MFNEVVSDPFARLMDDFVSRYPDPTSSNFGDTVTRPMTRQVYEVFEKNEAMFRALFAGQNPPGEEGAPSFRGLNQFFEQSVDQVIRRYASVGQKPAFDINIGVRLGLGMIAASVMMRDSLFPDGTPDREALIQALEEMVELAISAPPAPPRPD